MQFPATKSLNANTRRSAGRICGICGRSILCLVHDRSNASHFLSRSGNSMSGRSIVSFIITVVGIGHGAWRRALKTIQDPFFQRQALCPMRYATLCTPNPLSGDKHAGRIFPAVQPADSDGIHWQPARFDSCLPGNSL